MIKPAFLDLPGTASYLSLGVSSIERLSREDKTFPRPRLLTGRRVGYPLAELDAWAEARPVADLLPPKNAGKRKAVAA